MNSDTYAFYGLIAGLADRFIRLSIRPPDAEAGVLLKDPTIPQRKMRRGKVEG